MKKTLKNNMPLILEHELTSVIVGIKASPYVPGGLRLC